MLRTIKGSKKSLPPWKIFLNDPLHVLPVKKGHKNTNVPLNFEVCDVIFFVLGKIYKGLFLEIFDPFWPKIALRHAQGNLGIKKDSALTKNLSKWPIICFAHE